MAKVSGSAAFQRLQVPQDGLSQSIQFWGAQEAKRAENQNLAMERAQVRKSEELKEWEKFYNLKEDQFRNKYTGYKGYDDMATDFSIDLTNQYVELQRKAKEAMMNGDTRGKMDAEMEMVKMKNVFGEAAKIQPFLADTFTKYQKASSEGRVSGVSKDFEDIMKAGFRDNNVAMRYRNGNLIFTGITEDGKTFNVPRQDIMDGSFGWIEKQDVNGKEGLVNNILGTLGTIKKESVNGYYNISTQAWDDKIHGDSTRKAIKSITSSDDAMADLLYQVSQGKTVKRNNFTEEDYKLVSDELEKRVYAGYKQNFDKEFNTAKYNADLDAAASAARLKFDKEQANKPKQKTAEEAEYGARRFNIESATKGDISMFNQSGRSIEWGGSKVEVKGASKIGNNLVIKTDSTPIVVPLNNSTALNDLFNAFEGKVTSFDKVMSVEPYQWRNSETTPESDITSLLDGQYSPSGEFIGEETDFVRAMKNLYPDVKIEEAVFGKNAVKINGETIYLDVAGKAEVERLIRKSVGEKAKSGTTMTPEQYYEKYNK